MSNTSGYASEPMPFSEYAGVGGSSYPALTTLPPLAGPKTPGQLSNKAAALKARLAGGSMQEDDVNVPGSLVHPSVSPLMAAPTQPIPAGPSLTTTQGLLGDPASMPAAVHAYSHAATMLPQMPVWQSDSSNAYGTIPLLPQTTPGMHPAMPGDRLERVLTMLEQQAMGRGKGAGPDTTTEDLVSLAFVGIFFMLAVHALTPPVPYRR